MATEADFDDDERAVELSSITAIFPELKIDDKYPFTATLDLEVAPTEPLRINFTGGRVFDASGAEVKTEESHKFEYLPDLQLKVELPEGYPDERPPVFRVATAQPWLPEQTLRRLSLAGDELWEEYGRSQVVYAYIDYLQQAAERAFDLRDTLTLPSDLRLSLAVHDRSARKRKFDEGTYHCGICLDPKRGSACHKMWRCGHVFCRACLQNYYDTAITEGDVSVVKCLDPDCGVMGMTSEQRRAYKARSVHPRELLAIPLGRDKVKRYVDMKVKKRFESDKNTIYCPRTFCQKPARTKKDEKYLVANVEDYPSSSEGEEEEDIEAEANIPPNPPARVQPDNANETVLSKPRHKPPADRLAICSSCAFAFCRVCKKSWHGDFMACRPATDDPSTLSADDLASMEFIRKHTSVCPSCNAPCQKTQGCNHMRCFACDSHFCYLCSAWLIPEDPYRHFNTRGTECFMRLWELEGGDENPDLPADENLFGGARRAEMAWQMQAFGNPA